MQPFDDVNVRHAFSESIDRDALIKSVRRGIGKAAYSWLPPGVPDYDESLGKDYRFDATKAKADFARSKYGTNLPALKLTIANSASGKLQAEFVQQQLQTNLGVKTELEVLENAVYKSRYQRSDFQMVIGGWSSDYADPEDWIPDLFGVNGGNNKYKYSNPQVDRLIRDASSTSDNDRRLKIYADARKIIVEDMPVAFLYYAQLNGLKKPYVRGVIPTGLDGLSDRGESGDRFFTNVSIAKH